MFVVQLFIYGFHELTEANLFPTASPALGHRAYGPDGRYGQFLTYLRWHCRGGAGSRRSSRQEKLRSFVQQTATRYADVTLATQSVIHLTAPPFVDS